MIYLDHAATTPLRAEVLEAMLPHLRGEGGNPSSVHGPGRRARVAVDAARESVAGVLGVAPGEVVFTSGGTEADNAALHVLRGESMRASGRTGLVTSAAEHEAVRRPAAQLAREGHDVVLVPPTPTGAADADALVAAITPATGLVSAMWVNNEVGAVTDVAELAARVHAAGALLHTDAVQAPGVLAVDVPALGADYVSLSAHKLGGPPGVGALVVRGGAPYEPLVRGGTQERGRRAGTENVAGVVGLAEALRLAASEQAEQAERLAALRARLAGRLADAFGETIRWNTPLAPGASAPHILNISFLPSDAGPFDGDLLLLGLDLDGVAVSAGSACTSGALEPSAVLLAMGVPRDTAAATVRYSLGRRTTVSDVDAAVDATVRVAARMRGVAAAQLSAGSSG